MVNRSQNGQRRWYSLAAIGAFILSAPMLTGCSSTPTTTQQQIDPLLGYSTPPGTPLQPHSAPKAVTAPIAPPPQTGSINVVPAIPTNNTATNPATLATMSGNEVSLARPLAITDEDGRVQTAARSQPSGYVPPNSNPKVEPVPEVNPSPPTGSWQLPAANSPPTLPPANSAKTDPNDALRQQLQARGVVNQKVDPVAGGVHLTCYVPRSDSPGERVLEVTAADYPTAAQAILRQLEPRPQ